MKPFWDLSSWWQYFIIFKFKNRVRTHSHPQFQQQLIRSSSFSVTIFRLARTQTAASTAVGSSIVRWLRPCCSTDKETTRPRHLSFICDSLSCEFAVRLSLFPLRITSRTSVMRAIRETRGQTWCFASDHLGCFIERHLIVSIPDTLTLVTRPTRHPENERSFSF